MAPSSRLNDTLNDRRAPLKCLTLSLMCRMNLVNFPLDNQTCHIQFESYSDTIDKLVFTWADEPIQFNTEKGLDLAEFVFLNTETGVCAKNYSTGNYSCIIGKFRFKRKVTYYLMQTYLPTGLFVSLSWISFWIDEAHIGARITLGILTVLTTTAQGNLISKNLPRLSYIKAIDVWMSVCDQLQLCWLLNVRTCKVTS
ncbi:Glycine receptor subunit alpha-2 [Lamellibrachia satsuma]|nr:Glycine receptor subunit alpha-2 [Lamellibrachia satsuma]